MFPSGYGLYDLYRRNGISGDQDGRAKAAGKQHDWNQMEILAIGSRIRFAVNGKEVLDWTDPKPELCEANKMESCRHVGIPEPNKMESCRHGSVL